MVETVRTCADFILAETGRGREIFQELQKRQVIVRPVDPYGLPNHGRISIGTPAQNRKVMDALKEILA